LPYTERYVAFIDILGFGQIVSETGRRGGVTMFDADRLVEVLTQIGSRVEERGLVRSDDFKFQTFSDSVVLSEKASVRGFGHLTITIRSLTIDLLRQGLLMRGGIAKGKLHHDEKIMFGPAFLEAYRIESTVANYPRVVLSRDVYLDYQAMVRRDEVAEARVLLADDGPAFINVLELFRHSRTAAVLRARMRRAAECQAALQQLLTDSIHEPKHFEKLRWFAIYWNSVVGNWENGAAAVVFPASTREQS
jgi:hypothetical protein